MERKHFYNSVFKKGRDVEWNDAPGKKVLLSAFLDLIKNKENVIVDIGCGNGYFISEIKKHNPVTEDVQTYHAFDISDEAIYKAKAKYFGIVFKPMDACNIEYPDKCFDIVLSYGVVEHINDPMIALSEIERTLKPDGLFFIMIPSLDYYRTDKINEGWYEDLDINRQLQWNYKRKTWEEMFYKAGLKLFDINESIKYGALKPGVFFFGTK